MAAPIVTVAGYLSLDAIDAPAGRFTDVPGGAALYAALGAAAAGARVRLAATAGRDFPPGVLRALGALGIDTGGVARTDAPSRRTRLEDARAAAGRSSRRASPHYDDPAWWQATGALAPAPVADPGGVLVCTPMPAACLARQVAAARAAGARVVADTSEAFARREREPLLSLIADLDLFAPSREEVALLLPDHPDDEALRALTRRCPRVVLKAGARGLWWSEPGRPVLHQPSIAGRVLDATGAGDAAVGALAAGLGRGLAPAAMLALASEVAARALAGVGPAGFGLVGIDA